MTKHSYDYTLLVMTIVLVLFGVVMVFSASFYSAENSSSTGYNGYFYFWKQIMGVAIGLVAMVACMLIDYHVLIKLRFVFIIGALLLMGLVFVPGIGIERNGSHRWINLGFMELQPVEVLKFAIVVFMAGTIARNRTKMRKFTYGMLPYLGLLMVCGVLLYLQPNFSAVVTLALLVFVMMLVGGANLKHFGLMALTGLLGGTVAMLASEDAQYRVQRILAFTDPWKYSKDYSYQLVQSLYAIGSGGMFGLGLGNSRQKFLYLPYSESDCIYAIIVEELGYVGGLAVLAAFGVLIWRGVRTALHASDDAGMMLATGITALIAIQVFINVGVVTGFVPPTGVVLPFISAGNTSLLVFMASMGVLLNVSKQGNMA